MATITFWSIDLTRRHHLPKSRTDDVLTQVKRAEKTTFAQIEALDLDLELKKRNTNLVVLLGDVARPDVAAVSANLIYARTQKTGLLHNVCVLRDYRR